MRNAEWPYPGIFQRRGLADELGDRLKQLLADERVREAAERVNRG
jgi:hypothetical protein